MQCGVHDEIAVSLTQVFGVGPPPCQPPLYKVTRTLATRDENPRLDGTALLTLREGTDRKLIGDYWTDRMTRGHIALTLRRKKFVNSDTNEHSNVSQSE